MRHMILGAVGTLLLSSGLFAADSQLLNLVMPDAQVMGGINVTAAKTSVFGQYLLTQIAARGGDQFEKLSAATGFDPRRDLVEVLAASPGNAGQKSGLVLAKGVFNVSQLTDAVAKSGHGGQVTSYNGATLITAEKDHGAVAFLDGSIAIAGDVDSVKAAVDRSTQTNSISPELAAKVQALSAADDAWSVSLTPLAALAPAAANGQPAEVNQLLKNIQAANGGVKFGSLIVLSGQALAKDAASAGALADVVRMFAGLAVMNGQKNPQVAQILQSLQVSTDGAVVNVSLSVPEADAEQILNIGAQPRSRTRRGDH